MVTQFVPQAMLVQIHFSTNSTTDTAVGVSVGWHRFRPQAEAMDVASQPCLSPSARRHATRLHAEYDRTRSAKTFSTGVKQ